MAAEWQAGTLMGVPGAQAAILTFRDRLERAEVPELCGRASGWLDDGAHVLVCEISYLSRPDLVAVEALARLRLLTERRESALKIRGNCAGLTDLLDLVGLRETVE